MYVFNRITVNPQLPKRIGRITEIANNLWWSWNTEFLRLFKMIDMMDAKNPLYIGDSYIDAQTAQNAKIDFVGVTTGTTSREKLESYSHIVVLDDLKELLNV